MKKVLRVLICILILLWILIGVYFIYSKFFMNRELAGEQLTTGLYVYNIYDGDDTHSIRVVNNNIIYWIQKDDKYVFYNYDIYSNETKQIGDYPFNDESYCYIDKNYINCTNSNHSDIYNYKFKTIYSGEDETIVPYKKSYIKIKNNTLYYKNKEYKKMDGDFSNLNLYDYEMFDDNMFLFFANYEADGCLYNISKNKCEDYKYNGIKRYDSGLYYYDENKIHIVDVNGNEIKEYDNFTKNPYLITSQLSENKLYYFVDDYLRIYNLETGKVSLFDYRINEMVEDVYLNNNLLYLIADKKLYIVKLDEISLNEITIEELDNELNKRITDRIEKIKNDYNVEVMIRKDADLKFKVFKESTKGEREYDLINDSLDYTEEVLELFGKDFFKEFIHNEYKGLRIYLTSDIKSSLSYGINGEAFRYYDNYAILANSSDYKRTLCHELMHSMEDAVEAKWKEIFKKWDKYNPKGFKYKNDFNEYEQPYKYTINYGKGDVYFVDNYSQTNGLEDRARVFENICMNTTNDIKQNPYLLKKAQYLESEILRYYPMLKDSVIFDSINDNK